MVRQNTNHKRRRKKVPTRTKRGAAMTSVNESYTNIKEFDSYISIFINGDPNHDTLCTNCGLGATLPSDMCRLCGAYAAKKLTAKLLDQDIGDWV